MLKRTPLHDFHVSAGARMVEFAGWEMPILYRSIADEHEQTRRSASIFDVSHMGRLEFSGPDAEAFLNHVLTRNVATMKPGQSRYSLVCNEAGGVLDDVIVSRDAARFPLVCNASNREALLAHFATAKSAGPFDVRIEDQTESTVMVAIQGPAAIDKLADVLPVDLRGMKRYAFARDSIMLVNFTVFRSGYTGEDGVELVLPARAAGMAIKMLAGRLDRPDAWLKPAGLGARDTLRLEAAMPLYGHELHERIDPLSANLGWAVDLSKPFIGAEALRRIADEGPARRLVGLELEGRRIARQGAAVQASSGSDVGAVTSGTFAPTLQKSIALAYVDRAHAEAGTPLRIDLRGASADARVVPLPFYKRA